MIEVDTYLKFEEILSTLKDQLILVDFYTPWCGPCKRLAPKLEELSAQYQDKVTFLKVDVDELSEVGEKYQIEVLPTLLFFKDGKQLLESFQGSPPISEIEEIIKKYI